MSENHSNLSAAGTAAEDIDDHISRYSLNGIPATPSMADPAPSRLGRPPRPAGGTAVGGVRWRGE
ncbi:hypothetical protein OG625_02890 [Streptomyces sp. NBC_01351]|uniref:hypothetical protein n=1 Tax=Streptomyces sp. NBC_01351 TaxID=2903833 RepID=UPI002E361C2C|nr:hypothetical protein [Streptomyces sp. NBC_01351]